MANCGLTFEKKYSLLIIAINYSDFSPSLPPLSISDVIARVLDRQVIDNIYGQL